MVERGNRPSAIPVSQPGAAINGQVEVDSERVKLSLPSGETAEILLYGATVVSWKAAGGAEEKLFVSEKAVLDGTKAIRGGIPLVFPVFGTTAEGPAAALPQHGFARISKWEMLGWNSECESTVSVDLGLGSQTLSAEMREKWRYPFGLIYSVTLNRSSLETKMLVKNEGTETFNFHMLFHTYLSVPDINKIAIAGLKNREYKDKLLNGAVHTESGDTLGIAGETDRVYKDAQSAVTVEDGGRRLFRVEKDNLRDVVVWNPWEGCKKMLDFGPKDGFKKMVCVEPGSVAEWQSLEPGNVWEGGQVIYS